MKIEIKHLKYNPRKSAVYRAYQATVLIDGEYAGVVSSLGDGSINDYEPFTLRHRLNEYAKTLPPMATEFCRDGTPLTFQPNCDYVVEQLVEARLAQWTEAA